MRGREGVSLRYRCRPSSDPCLCRLSLPNSPHSLIANQASTFRCDGSSPKWGSKFTDFGTPDPHVTRAGATWAEGPRPGARSTLEIVDGVFNSRALGRRAWSISVARM